MSTLVSMQALWLLYWVGGTVKKGALRLVYRIILALHLCAVPLDEKSLLGDSLHGDVVNMSAESGFLWL